MSTRLILTLCASAAVLTACATKQKNPIYKYSTKYKGSAPYTAVASNAGASAATYQTASQSTGAATSGYQTIQGTPQTQSTLTYASSASSNNGYTLPASSQATRTLKKCAVSGGVETCQLVEVPVSAIQASSSTRAGQSSYLTPAATTYSTGGQLEESCFQGGVPVSCATGAALTQASLTRTSSATPSSGRLTQVDSVCLQGGVSVPCDPLEIPITSQASVSAPYFSQSDNIVMAHSAAPTDTAYTDTGVGGTPGYYAVNNAPTVTAAPTAPVYTQSQAYSEPQYVDVLPDVTAYTTATTTIAQPVPSSGMINAATVPSNSLYSDNYADSYTGGYITQNSGGVLHTVVAGDTVYSMKRKTCTSVEEIRSMNGINSDNYIRVGDTIRLPASRC